MCTDISMRIGLEEETVLVVFLLKADALTTLNVALAGVPRADGVQRGSRGPEIGLELLGLLQDYQKSGKCSAQWSGKCSGQ